jgi:general secretion pathway protein C
MQLRFSQIHVTILNFVLVAALAIVSAMCVRDVIARSVSNDQDAPAAAAFAPKAAGGPRTRASYDEIVKRDIFNETPQASGPAPVVEADLNLKLIGTSLASKSRPYAIIEDPAGNESLYQVGEDIPNAGKLVTVEVNRAIIDRNGHRVALEIPTSDLPAAPPSNLGGAFGRLPGFGGIPGAIRRRLRGGGAPVRINKGGDDSDDNDNNDSSADDNSSAKVQLKKLGPGQYEASRAQVQQSMEDPTQFFTQMRALPHFVDGKTDGFAISQVAPGSVFEQLGLQNGDLLTSINGQPITNPMQALSLMQAMKSAPAIDLIVNRGGAPTSVHLTLR